MENACNGDNENDCTSEYYQFHVRDCALVSIATGHRAQNLREFAHELGEVNPGSIYHHFWGRLMFPTFAEPEYNNDFASWASHALHEKALAERLSMIDPAEHDDIESLRREVIEIVESRLDESEMVPWARTDQQFHFLRSQIVVLDTGRVIENPPDLSYVVPELTRGSVFYHFIDARRRTDTHSDDFSAWLEGFEGRYSDLCRKLEALDPYFSPLEEIQVMLCELFGDYFGNGGYK